MSQMSAMYEHECLCSLAVNCFYINLSGWCNVVLKYKLEVLKTIKGPLCNMLLHSRTARGGPRAKQYLRS